jgi:hypothetical protein
LNKKLLFTVALGAGLSVATIFPVPANAHNSGHVFLPSGECIEVGGNNSVGLPDNAQAYTNTAGERDLIPGTSGDEIGARFAAEQGNSRVQPRGCP